MLVTLLIGANCQKQRLLAFGLSEHYKHIFELTRLNEAIGIVDQKQMFWPLLRSPEYWQPQRMPVQVIRRK